MFWKLYTHDEEYGEIITRKILQMQMDLNELFIVLQFVVGIEQEDIQQRIMRDV